MRAAAPDAPGARAAERRAGPYLAAAVVGVVAGEIVVVNGLLFALPLVPEERRLGAAAALLAIGLVGGAAGGVLLLRAWWRRAP